MTRIRDPRAHAHDRGRMGAKEVRLTVTVPLEALARGGDDDWDHSRARQRRQRGRRRATVAEVTEIKDFVLEAGLHRFGKQTAWRRARRGRPTTVCRV